MSGEEITRHALVSILKESIILILRILFIAYIEDIEIFRKILEENKSRSFYIPFRCFFYNENTKNKLEYKKIIKIFNFLNKSDNTIEFSIFN